MVDLVAAGCANAESRRYRQNQHEDDRVVGLHETHGQKRQARYEHTDGVANLADAAHRDALA